MFDRIISFALSSRLLIVVVGLLMMSAGWMAYRDLPVDAFPDVSPNLVQVFTVTEGLAPEEVETYITYPVETVMNGLPGITKIRSISNFGLSVVNVYFEDDIDIYFARQLVNERLQEAREQIPDGFGEPAMGPISTGMGLVLFYYLEDTTGTRSLTELRSIQDWLVKYHLQTVPGVTEVLGIGGWEKQFHVVVDPEALLRYDIGLHDVLDALEANNLNAGAQFIEQNSEEYIVRSIGLATGIEDLREVVIKTMDGIPIRIHDVALVREGGAVRRGLQTHNGIGEIVSGQVIKLFGTNSSTVISAVENKMIEINQILPQGVRIVPYYDQKSLVEAAVSTVLKALVQGIVLVSLVILLFMGGWRPSVVVALSIPFSALMAFLLMRQFAISANLMSLGGLAIAIGMMVDGAVVMVENIDRMIQHPPKGFTHNDIVLRASKEVVRPVVFAILIILVVFAPVMTLQGVEGKTFRPLAYTIGFAMAGSLLYAVLLAPVLSSLLMRRIRRDTTKPSFSDRVNNGIIRIYEPVLRGFIRNRSFAIVLVVVLLAIGGIGLTQLGSEFTPELQEGTIVLRLTMAPSIALEESKRMTLLVEQRLMRIPEIREVVSRIGRGEVGAHTDPVNSAEMYILLSEEDGWRVSNQKELVDLIRDELGEVPGVAMNFTQPIAMTIDELLEGVRAELAVKLFGDDLDVLKVYADEIAVVLGEVSGARDIQVDQITGTPQLLVRIDRDAIARYGVSISEVQEVIEAAVGGKNAGQILEGIRRFEILVRYREGARDTPQAIRSILVPTPDGALVPLEQLATIETIIGPRQITREDNQRFISIQCNVEDRDIGSFVAEAGEIIRAEVDLPPGYLVTWGGQFRLQQEANKRLALVVPITLLLIALLLYSSFNSIKNTTLILLNIPLALVGGIVALWISGQNLSVPASVGFIALFGIALENGMVLVTYLNQRVREGMDMDLASVEGSKMRVRAVLMTAVTTAFGLLPLLFATGTGSEVQRPLATVVVGGLVTSTALTLLVIPALYKWFAIPVERDVLSHIHEDTD
ncbi:MAG TPA: efflux RND transporter permease subunit [Bacteroidetes bacterium]|nr:cobalt-zinc-cadmium resistance protein CzcA [bacterium BMS3Bbin04]HDO66330.1 efflux RND transporter permease subunit [Bacteroidota bacterium]HEX05455.1 efflux RND transporter permease subunit [Bacteroidota bacterium]